MAMLAMRLLAVLVTCASINGVRQKVKDEQNVDTDGDGIPDSSDICPGTQNDGMGVNSSGCRYSTDPTVRTYQSVIGGDIQSARLANGSLVPGFQTRFFDNPAYQCGRSGDHSFLILERDGTEKTTTAPLWIYLHGGGTGYYNSDGTYNPTRQEQHNDAEDRQGLTDRILSIVVSEDGRIKEVPLKRRMQQGYRILVISMCDHDSYWGRGQPYPNNPNREDTVNGLQAAMSAIEYTVVNFATSHVFVQGCSAGGFGAWGVSFNFAAEGKPLTGAIIDSGLYTPLMTTMETFRGKTNHFGRKYPFDAEYSLEARFEKTGSQFGLDFEFAPENVIEGGYTATPTMDSYGFEDIGCGWNFDPIIEEGVSNCDWLHNGFRRALEHQRPGSRHIQVPVPKGPHCIFREEGWWVDKMDEWMSVILEDAPVPCLVPGYGGC